jgi:hypothetical protein
MIMHLPNGNEMTKTQEHDITFTVHRGIRNESETIAECSDHASVYANAMNIAFETIAECSDHASAYATVIADYTKMNTGKRLAWTRPKWTAVSGESVLWVINIRKSDGTYIYGRTMGPSRLELEMQQSEVTDDKPPFFVIVLHVKNRVARYVEGNFSGPDYILGNEKSGYPLSDGWWVLVMPGPQGHACGPFPTWKQAEALACHIDEAPTLEHAIAIALKMPMPEVMH